MESLSAVIITFNEEKNIERCLKSLQNVADEIIVVDSFSTDQTEAICQSFNVQFHKMEWEGYSKTKNKAQSLANSEYVISVDADECLDEQLIREISEIKKTGFNGIYELNRLTNYCGSWIHHSGWNPDWKIRIYPKSRVKWNDAIVHEELMVPTDLKMNQLKGRLHHYSYFSKSQHRLKADQYSKLTALKYAEQGRKCYFFTPFLSAVSRFLSMYILKLGFLDGKAGWNIAKISAESNAFKYRELRRLTKNTK
ncbi:MAG: glycosyltransferase family 2 protein [Bacteroidota bacterium]